MDEPVVVALRSLHRAQDGAYVALSDLGAVFADIDVDEATMIGGHMVAAHLARSGVEQRVPQRYTADADLGVALGLLRRYDVSARLRDLGYQQVAGNRFERQVADGPTATVDVLVPAATSRIRHNRAARGGLVVDETPGLWIALARPVRLRIDARLTNGDHVRSDVVVPAPLGALVLKTLTWRQRHFAKDATDVWRCLEVVHRDGLTEAPWPTDVDARRTVETLREGFLPVDGVGVHAAASRPEDRDRIRSLAKAVTIGR